MGKYVILIVGHKFDKLEDRNEQILITNDNINQIYFGLFFVLPRFPLLYKKLDMRVPSYRNS